ncbi:glycosyltransferase family 2 protein [Microvirga terrae]|uniref:Glycosyltransferase family 2 protein n=1 Tax=Microvirga terrae TaxID=2740529 RepID=A0ABY5RL00_9HYPH|nr:MULTISPECIES: glycosyltransferase family 2 protein [Microvirga]MBQ0823107.1 glycosyltransferase family 2 protein [Microvirga sp. HBU67558]UVF17880.1 glycosyltransferase family 2 protein [Microvirga terrae]
MSPHDVTAIVVTFDSAHALPECLGALAADGAPALVVDNASTDDTVAIAQGQGARVVRNDRNLGYGRANNIGVRAAGTAFVLVVNPDCVVDRGAVVALVDAARRYPDAAFFAPQIVEPSGRVFYQPRSLLATSLTNPGGKLVVPEGEACAPFFSGACFLIRRDVFLELGGFDENIFLFYEDDDLCRRVADSGSALIYVPQAVVRHGRGRSSGERPGRIFTSRWHQAWSRAYVSRKYGLPNPAPGMAAVNGLKAVAASLTFRRSLIERYAGSAAGAWAAMRGRKAF